MESIATGIASVTLRHMMPAKYVHNNYNVQIVSHVNLTVIKPIEI